MKNKEYLMKIKKEKNEKEEKDEDEKELAKIQEEIGEEMNLNLDNKNNKEIKINNDINKKIDNNYNDSESSHIKKMQPKLKNISLNSFDNNNKIN